MKAGPADAIRDINLTGLAMGQLRTANNRRNRAIRHSVSRLRAATASHIATQSDVAPQSDNAKTGAAS